jgi:hypothetical protein
VRLGLDGLLGVPLSGPHLDVLGSQVAESLKKFKITFFIFLVELPPSPPDQCCKMFYFVNEYHGVESLAQKFLFDEM